jgi:hypothetical protein
MTPIPFKLRVTTYGNFDSDIIAFIDWNRNDILDDAGEVFSIGILFNTNGNDGTVVSIAITIPNDAVIGITRVRLMKTYQDTDSPAKINPFGILFNPFDQDVFQGFGQALDFTIDIGTLSVLSFDKTSLSVYPTPFKELLNITCKSALDRLEIYNLLGQNIYEQHIATRDLELNMTSFTSGFYIVNIFAGEIQHSVRIVKD